MPTTVSRLSPSDLQALVKAAADSAAIVARMEKNAFLGRGLGFLGKQLARPFQAAARRFGSGGPPLMPPSAPSPSPAGAAGGGFSRGKVLGGLAGAGAAGSIGYGHLSNQAENSPNTHWYNPLTWQKLNPFSDPRPKAEDIFRRNNDQFSAMSGDLRRQYQEAISKGDNESAARIRQQLDSGDFGGAGLKVDWDELSVSGLNPLKWRFGGLNPWGQQTGAYYQRNALGAQKSLQDEYDTAMRRWGPQAGDQDLMAGLQKQLESRELLPHQASLLQSEIDAVKKRMAGVPGQESPDAKGIRERMERSSMRLVRPGTPAGAPAPASPMAVGTWPTGRRPQMSNTYYGNAIGRDDARERNIWQNPWEGVSLTTMPS